jgi:pimeloyl-ACP methyl ester carboxylesterase
VQLHLRTWGSGPRTALLVHGFSDDATTWWRVAPALAEHGFTVLAPDLRGHGRSPRAEDYTLEALAADLVASLPTGADLAVGHSLGAAVLALAVPALAPGRVVLVDPCWLRPRRDFDLGRPRPLTRDELPAETAGWSDEDVRVDLASNALLDPRVGPRLLAGLSPDALVPATPAGCSVALVQVPDQAPVLPVEAHEHVRAVGYAVRTVPGTGHVIHRDAPEAFLDAVLRVADPVG